jgi:hypothetical protein
MLIRDPLLLQVLLSIPHPHKIAMTANYQAVSVLDMKNSKRSNHEKTKYGRLLHLRTRSTNTKHERCDGAGEQDHSETS